MKTKLKHCKLKCPISKGESLRNFETVKHRLVQALLREAIKSWIFNKQKVMVFFLTCYQISSPPISMFPLTRNYNKIKVK